MKIVALLLCCFILLIACNGNNLVAGSQSEPSTNDSIGKLAELEKIALASKRITDTVLLNYRFGMPSEQVVAYTEKLYSQGKLKKVQSGKYYFEITGKMGEVYKGFLFTDYFQNKLYSVGLTFSEEVNNIRVFSTMNDLLKQKYGEAEMMDKPFNDANLYERYWFKNNLKIKLTSGLPDASVRYIDLRYEKQKERADSIEKASSEKEIRNNL